MIHVIQLTLNIIFKILQINNDIENKDEQYDSKTAFKKIFKEIT